ncbi:hypothetical protein JXA84_07435 [candidate division WOR-3 bacterium]|nr:hypothetical protein [candidate division WOR-3 bacterium]
MPKKVFFSLLVPGLGQILCKRYAYGIFLFLALTITPFVASLTAGSPDNLYLFSFLNPFLLLSDSLIKNDWTWGFAVLIITIFSVLFFSIFETIKWCKKNTR